MPSMLGRLLSESYMEVDVEKYISKHSQRDSMEADLIRKALPSRWSRATSDVGYSSSASVDLVDPSVRPKTPRGPRPRSWCSHTHYCHSLHSCGTETPVTKASNIVQQKSSLLNKPFGWAYKVFTFCDHNLKPSTLFVFHVIVLYRTVTVTYHIIIAFYNITVLHWIYARLTQSSEIYEMEVIQYKLSLIDWFKELNSQSISGFLCPLMAI